MNIQEVEQIIRDKCPKCGSILQISHIGSTQSASCAKCGWSVATSYFSPLELDDKNYVIFVKQNATPNIHQIKAISKISGDNFVEIKKKYQLEKFEVFTGRAIDVLPIKEKLEKENIAYSIVPDFKY